MNVEDIEAHASTMVEQPWWPLFEKEQAMKAECAKCYRVLDRKEFEVIWGEFGLCGDCVEAIEKKDRANDKGSR